MVFRRSSSVTESPYIAELARGPVLAMIPFLAVLLAVRSRSPPPIPRRYHVAQLYRRRTRLLVTAGPVWHRPVLTRPQGSSRQRTLRLLHSTGTGPSFHWPPSLATALNLTRTCARGTIPEHTVRSWYLAPRGCGTRDSDRSSGRHGTKYWRYLRYIIVHKWRVMIECWREGLYWQGITHDLSKLSRVEFGPYARWFFGHEARSSERELAWERAWRHHQHRNRHHRNHWVIDPDRRQATPMPRRYIVKMFCDWRPSGTGDAGGTKDWKPKLSEKTILHPSTLRVIERMYGLYGEQPDGPKVS